MSDKEQLNIWTNFRHAKTYLAQAHLLLSRLQREMPMDSEPVVGRICASIEHLRSALDLLSAQGGVL
jgi:hypothetical protein